MPDTGWRELTDSGLNILTEGDMIYENAMNSSPTEYIKDIYGDGSAAKKIISILRNN